MNIEIISDFGEGYNVGQVVPSNELIDSFCECTDDESLIDFIRNSKEEKAIAFISDAWGIEYKILE